MAILGHELRTPLAAILGYQELLDDGIYGQLSARQKEPMERIQRSAEQILSLIDGLQDLAAAGSPSEDEETSTDTRFVLDSLSQRLQPVAEARGVHIEFVRSNAAPLEHFLLHRFLRAAEMAIIAAIKSSNGCTLRIECSRQANAAVCTVTGSRLDADRDHPVRFSLEARDSTPPTVGQVRLAMAAATLAAAAGTVRLLPAQDGATLELSLPLGLVRN